MPVGNHQVYVSLIVVIEKFQCGSCDLSGRRFEAKLHEGGGGSFLSSHDPQMVLGIGARTKIDWIEIEWPRPGGVKQRLTDLPIDRYITVPEAPS
jgi:hypothetical protein